MKGRKMTLVLLMVTPVTYGQNINEFLRQKKTRIRYLTEQIAALQVMIELGQKGYAIYRDGLDLIGDVKDGEFNLHKDYFASLSRINPRIGQSPQVADMYAWQEQIRRFTRKINALDLGSSTASLRKLFTALTARSAERTEQLRLLTTDGHYQLTDDERWQQLHDLYNDFERLYRFARSTYDDALRYAGVHRHEEQEMKVMQQLQGVRE
jgi:hypothetical protein